jgi:hypothetical protein
MQFRSGGEAVPHQEYLKMPAELLRQDEWIIDGYGGIGPAWERADTLVYIDLPLVTHGWRLTVIRGFLVAPEGSTEKQSAVEQYLEQLQGTLALPSPANAQIQTACR